MRVISSSEQWNEVLLDHSVEKQAYFGRYRHAISIGKPSILNDEDRIINII